MYKGRPIFIPIIAILVLISVAIWYLTQNSSGQVGGYLEASGTIEVVEVSIAPELAGRVAEVLVDQGDPVKAGDPLLQLDDELLQSQRQRASAALEAAQANLSAAQAGLEAAQASLNVAEANAAAVNASAEAQLVPLRQAKDELYENADLARAEAERTVAAASRAVRETTYLLDNYTIPTEQQGLTAMEAVTVMKERLDTARQDFEPYKNEDSGNTTRKDLKEALDEAQSNYDAAVRRLEYETAVQQAQARLTSALQDLQALQDGPDPDKVATLEAQITAAEAAPKQTQAVVEQAQVGITQAQARLEQSQAALEQAQAELDLQDIQLKKLTIYSPVAGVVLSRDIEPGEVIQPGASAMTIGQLERLTITVYIPEDRYGQVKLGQQAEVSVDSFPGEVFKAHVVHIADQAEFTPRNVQTAEGRRTTVFGVVLAVENVEGMLKPGMPADVVIIR